MSAPSILDVRDVKKHFRVRRLFSATHEVRAVDGVSFSVKTGRTFGLVGESGSGKSTVAKLTLLLEPLTSGEIDFEGQNVAGLAKSDRRHFRAAVQAVFQDPYSSLNPRHRIGQVVAEPIRATTSMKGSAVKERVEEVVRQVGLPANTTQRFPHEFSGGQRQRIAIARALAVKPRLIVLDEPVSALDVSIRAQILNLLADLQAELGLSYLLIAHDLAIVEHMAHEIGVMYLGKIMERAPADVIYAQPLHPYTHALLAAVPVPDPTSKVRPAPYPAEIANTLQERSGCRFSPRCPHVTPECKAREPELREVLPGHFAACHYAENWASTPTFKQKHPAIETHVASAALAGEPQV